MLTIRNKGSRDYNELYAVTHYPDHNFDQGWYDDGIVSCFSGDFRPGSKMDIFFRNIYHHWLIGPVSVSRFLGLSNTEDDKALYQLKGKPPNNYPYDSLLDGQDFGTIFTAPFDLWHRRETPPKFGGCHNVEHFSYRGDWTFGQRAPMHESKTGSISYLLDVPVLQQDSFYDLERIQQRAVYYDAGGTIRPYLALWGSPPQSYPEGTLGKHMNTTQFLRMAGVVINHLRPKYGYTIVDGYAMNFLSYAIHSVDMSMQVESDFVQTRYKVVYEFENRAVSNRPNLIDNGKLESNQQFLATMLFEASYLAPANIIAAYPGLDYDLCGVLETGLSINYQEVKFSSSYPIPSTYPSMPHGGLCGETPSFETVCFGLRGQNEAKPNQLAAISRWFRGGRASDNLNARLEQFESYVSGLQHESWKMAASSTAQAVEKLNSSSNFLESVPELPGILRNVANVANLAKHFMMLCEGDVTVVPALTRDIAQGYLAYKYGARPLASDITEANRIASEIVTKLDGLSQLLTSSATGSASAKRQGDFPFGKGELRITVRSTLYLHKSLQTILAYFLLMKEVGLAPTLANLWDLVPFSFVVDWFLNLSRRFEDIDGISVSFVLDPAYYIHSYLWEFVPEERLFASLGLVTDGTPPLRAYFRRKSLVHPTFGYTAFDLRDDTAVKRNLFALGSLLLVSS
jgi:hypothetical protein